MVLRIVSHIIHTKLTNITLLVFKLYFYSTRRTVYDEPPIQNAHFGQYTKNVMFDIVGSLTNFLTDSRNI